MFAMHETAGSKRPRSGLANVSLADVIAALIVLAVAAVAIVNALKLPIGSLSSPEAGFIPILEGVLLAGAGVALLILAAAKPRAAPLDWPREDSRRTVPLLSGALIGFVFLLPHAGFAVAAFLFLWFSIRLWRQYSPVTSALIAGGVAAGLHMTFVTFLKMPLPRGVLGLY